MKGMKLPVKDDLNQTIIKLLEEGLDKDLFGAVLIPTRVPSGDSFAYLLISDKSMLQNATALPPVMPVQGAKALSSLTRQGSFEKRVVAVMRPCEIRAAVELAKLEQVDLENVSFLSVDCPGALPLSEYLEDPEGCDELFEKAPAERDTERMRPTCRMCLEFGPTSGDLHVGLLSGNHESAIMIAASEWGAEVLESLGIQSETSLEEWSKEMEQAKSERRSERERIHNQLNAGLSEPAGLLDLFAKCIDCHNCMRVCPMCYCRQCYFDSEALQLSAENFLSRARKSGWLRLPTDTMFFQLGRMSHMISSCVSCGQCEDACPMDIDVAQIFSLVADRTQETLEYTPGMDVDEPLPCTNYREEELREIEEPYVKIYHREGVLRDVQSVESK
jgi:formate dehydrogenase subunit beta